MSPYIAHTLAIIRAPNTTYNHHRRDAELARSSTQFHEGKSIKWRLCIASLWQRAHGIRSSQRLHRTHRTTEQSTRQSITPKFDRRLILARVRADDTHTVTSATENSPINKFSLWSTAYTNCTQKLQRHPHTTWSTRSRVRILKLPRQLPSAVDKWRLDGNTATTSTFRFGASAEARRVDFGQTPVRPLRHEENNGQLLLGRCAGHGHRHGDGAVEHREAQLLGPERPRIYDRGTLSRWKCSLKLCANCFTLCGAQRTCWWNEVCKEEFQQLFRCKCPQWSFCRCVFFIQISSVQFSTHFAKW